MWARGWQDHLLRASGRGMALKLKLTTVELSYQIKGEKQTTSQEIALSFVPNHYGGQDRIYFRCPGCGERVRMLYFRGRFCCRACAGLTYPSQRVTAGWSKAAMQLQAAALPLMPNARELAPLDLFNAVPDRPKGMHRATYTRRLLRLLEAQRNYWAEFSKAAGRIITR